MDFLGRQIEKPPTRIEKPPTQKSKCVGGFGKCRTENLEGCSQMEFCKETRKSFNNTKNSLVLPLDRILGFFGIYYYGLDTDCAESVSKPMQSKRLFKPFFFLIPSFPYLCSFKYRLTDI
jgi:hypothetical protein